MVYYFRKVSVNKEVAELDEESDTCKQLSSSFRHPHTTEAVIR